MVSLFFMDNETQTTGASSTLEMTWNRFEELLKQLDAANISLTRNPLNGEWELCERQKNSEGKWCAHHFVGKMRGPLVPMLEEYFRPPEEANFSPSTHDNMKNKEQIYDAEIYPLMGKIIEICQANKISMFATFDIPNDEDATLTCTTCTSDESGKPSERIRQFNRLAPQNRSPLMLRKEHADGSQTMTAILG